MKLPRDVGAAVYIQQGLGDLQTGRGLQWNGNAYVNEAHGKPGPTLRIHVTSGIGNIAISLV